MRLSENSDVESVNPKIYQFMARAYIGVGNVEKAEAAIRISDSIDDSSVDANYAHLKIAIKKKDIEMVKVYVGRLIDSGYSTNLVKADPGLSFLLDNKII